MPNLNQFTLQDMTRFGIDLRQLGSSASSMEAVAEQIVTYLYQQLQQPDGEEPACALLRLFKTHPYGELPPDLQQAAAAMMPEANITPETKCLTLLATQGQEEAWQSRQQSQGHRAIPLVSEQVVEQIPMIARLIQQFGLDVATVLEPAPALLPDLEQRTFNVFHVGEAPGSPYIPAQAEFVEPFGVQSVLGLGGILPSGNLFAVILFSKTPIPAETAARFKTLALNIKMALLPFEGQRVFT
jgi:hypothetical protein